MKASPPPALPLRRIVDLLDSEAGTPIVDRLEQLVVEHGRWDRTREIHSEVPGKGRVTSMVSEVRTKANLPKDAFYRAVVERVDSYPGIEIGSRRAVIPSAVADVYAEFSDPLGSTWRHLLPSEGAEETYDELVQALRDKPLLRSRPRLSLTLPSDATVEKMLRSRPAETYLARMPVLAKLRELKIPPGLFDGMVAAAHWHLLPTTAGLVQTLEAAGLPFLQNKGKPYSTPVESYATERLIHRRAGQESFWGRQYIHNTSQQSLYQGARESLRQLLEGVDPRTETRRFLIAADGGYLLQTLCDDFIDYAHLFVALEQTEYGGQVVEQLERDGRLLCDVVAVWKSEAKKKLESPAIGESVAYHIEHFLSEMHPKLSLEPKQAVLLGGGAVGTEVARALERRGYPRKDIVIVDPDPKVMDRVIAEGYGASLPEQVLREGHDPESTARAQVLAKGHLLVACAPGKAIDETEWDLLPNDAFAANAASGDHPLGCDQERLAANERGHRRLMMSSSGEVRCHFRGRVVNLGDSMADPHFRHRIHVTPSGKQVVFLRSGFVVNMTLGMPPEYAQVILGLLESGFIQMARDARSAEELHAAGMGKILDLDPKLQEKVLELARKEHLAKKGLSLEEPDFRKLERWY